MYNLHIKSSFYQNEIIDKLDCSEYNVIITLMNRPDSITKTIHARINFKILIVGDSGVGKTTLILNYVKGMANRGYSATLGM